MTVKIGYIMPIVIQIMNFITKKDLMKTLIVLVYLLKLMIIIFSLELMLHVQQLIFLL